MGFNIHDLGDSVRLTGTFTVTSDGAALDPDTVSVRIKDPDGAKTTYVYLTDPEVVKSATGIYYVDVSADKAGIWFYRWFSDGNGQAADVQKFEVETDPTA